MAALDCKPNFRGYGAGWSKKFLSGHNLGDHKMSKKIISNAAVVSNDFKAQCVHPDFECGKICRIDDLFAKTVCEN